MAARFLNTWKNSNALKATQCSDPLHSIKPELDTIWSCHSAHSADWLHLDSFHPCNMLHKDPRHLKKQYCHRCKSMFWPLAEHQAMNTQFLSTLQWHSAKRLNVDTVPPMPICSTVDHKAPRHLEKNSIVVTASQCSGQLCWVKLWIHFLSPLEWRIIQTGSTWIPFHPSNVLHLCHKAPRHLKKTVLPWRQVNVLATYTAADYEYTLSQHTAVADGADWLYLDTFPWKMLYHGPQGFFTPGKPWMAVRIMAISTGSNHDYTYIWRQL